MFAIWSKILSSNLLFSIWNSFLFIDLTLISFLFEIFLKMSKEDSHSISFNLPSSIGYTTLIPILFPDDYEVWALHFEGNVLGIKTHGFSILHVITKESYKHTKIREIVKTQRWFDGINVDDKEIHSNEKDKLMDNLIATRILRFTFQPNTFFIVILMNLQRRFGQIERIILWWWWSQTFHSNWTSFCV